MWTSLGAKNSCLESICPIPVLGKETKTWDHQIQVFCRYKGLGPWLEEAKCHHWPALLVVFYAFCLMWDNLHPKPMYIIQLFFSPPGERWVRRMLHWQPIGRGCVGRTPSNEPDKLFWAVFSNKTLGWLKERGYGCGPVDDGDEWVRGILFKIAELFHRLFKISNIWYRFAP